MSNGRAFRRHRGRRRLAPHTPRDEQDEYGVLIGVAENDDAIEEAKKKTHDQLIEQLGDARRGGVTWRIPHERGPDAIEVLDRLVGSDPDYNPTREHLRDWPEARLVIAAAEAVR